MHHPWCLSQTFYPKLLFLLQIFQIFLAQRSVTAAWATPSPWSIEPVSKVYKDIILKEDNLKNGRKSEKFTILPSVNSD